MMIEDPVNHEDRDDRHMSELLARLIGLGSHSVTPQQIMPWLVELFKFWKEGEEWRVVALSGDIARKLIEICGLPPGDVSAGVPRTREERGPWLVRYAISTLSRCDERVGDNCRMFLTHAQAWVLGA